MKMLCILMLGMVLALTVISDEPLGVLLGVWLAWALICLIEVVKFLDRLNSGDKRG